MPLNQELQSEEASWKSQSSQQSEALAATVAVVASQQDEHEEEVTCLSEKLSAVRSQSAALLLGHSLFVFQAVDLLVDLDLGLRLDWVEKSLFFGVPFELRHIVAHTSSKPKAATRAHKAPLVEHDEI